MPSTDTARPRNRYCERLGLASPDLDAAIRFPQVTLKDLMVLALLEAGEAQSLDAVASRLARLDLPPRLAHAGDPASLLKAWHGQPPLVRDPLDGLFYLDLLSHHDVRLVAFIGDRSRSGAEQESNEFRQPPDDVPLSQEEVEAAFKDRALHVYSSIRRAAAILEASGGVPEPLDEVNRRLVALAGRSSSIEERTARSWRSDLLRLTPDGLLHLDPHSADIAAFRRDIRKMALTALRERARRQTSRAARAERQTELAAEEQRDAEEARRARRALVHVVMVAGTPRAAAVIDAARRTLRSFVGDALADVPGHLAEFDVLAGVDVRPSLRALGLDPDRWWLADLRPTARTFRPSGQRPVTLTLPAIVQATTGRRAVPAMPQVWEALVRAGSAARLQAAVAREAEALLALYECGALHGGVRVRRRAGETLLPVSWSLPGDADLSSVVAASIRRWVPVEVAVGLPTGLGDPWDGVRTLSIVEREPGRLLVSEGGDVSVLETADIRAIRLHDAAAAASVRPAHRRALDTRTCRLKVTLDGIAPPIWRRIDVAAFMRMEKLHEMIQAAFGWTNSHLHVFEAGGERIGVPYELDDMAEGMITRSGRQVTLGDVIDHGISRFGYEYDFGDSWQHTIEVEEVRPERGDEGWARCLDGARACPPEDCGGVGGYERLLEILFDPRHPEFDETRRWAGDFEPDRFDLRTANAAMAAVSWY